MSGEGDGEGGGCVGLDHKYPFSNVENAAQDYNLRGAPKNYIIYYH